MSFWFRWFGILLGAISLFSLVQKLYGFGLAPIIRDMLAFYRAAFHPVADIIVSGLRWLLALIWIKLPQIPGDVVVVYLLIAAAFFRYSASEILYEHKKHELFSELVGGVGLWRYRGIATRRFLSTFVFSILWPLAVLSRLKNTRDRQSYAYSNLLSGLPPVTFRRWLVELSKVVTAFFILFATNAYFSPKEDTSTIQPATIPAQR
jgi:hypothetical protein